jgi:membrane-associated phospholipid phosphatase
MLASNTTAVGNGPPITQPPPSGPVARFDGTILAPNEPGPTLMAPQQAPVDPNAIQYAPTGPANPPPTADQPVFHRPSFEDRIHGFALRVWEDYRNYYTWGTACDVGIGLAVAASLAETPMDIHFRDWYQNDVRTSGTDSVAKVFKNFGEGTYMIPAAITLTVAGELLDEYPVAGTIGDFGERWTRAYIVGALPFLTLQYGLGAARPTWRDNASQWRPFQDSYGVSASGHAFISSVPFLTAAEMVDDPLLKGVFYFGSTLTAWSRVNDDAHFLSQVILGWCLGYVSVRAVNHTELEAKSNFSMTPVVSQDMTGVGFNFRW